MTNEQPDPRDDRIAALEAENARLRKSLSEGYLDLQQSVTIGLRWMEEAQGIAAALGLPPDAAPDAVLAAVKKSAETWRCFHCGFETTDMQEAHAHFGDRDDTKPLCICWARMSPEERGETLQKTIRELNEEREENALLGQKIEGLEYRLYEFKHTFENITDTRFKGAKSLNDIFHHYDSMEGRAIVGDVIRKCVIEALGLAEPADADAVLAAVREIGTAAQSVAACGWGWAGDVEHAERMAKMDRLRAAISPRKEGE